jgi:hypothetical protein
MLIVRERGFRMVIILSLLHLQYWSVQKLLAWLVFEFSFLADEFVIE